MKFEELDRRMRVYETAHDHCVLPGMHMVARIDGLDAALRQGSAMQPADGRHHHQQHNDGDRHRGPAMLGPLANIVVAVRRRWRDRRSAPINADQRRCKADVQRSRL